VLRSAHDATDAVVEAATALDRFADAVDALCSRTGTLRQTAAASGLAVTASHVLRPPAAGPPVARPAAFATPAQVGAYRQASATRTTALNQVVAFAEAAEDMAAVRTDLAAAESDLDRVTADVRRLLMPALDFGTGEGIGATVARGVGAMRGAASALLGDAQNVLAATRRPGAALFPRSFYGDLDQAAALRAQAAAVSDDAARLARAGRAGGWIVGGVLTGVSIYTDMQDGESAGQAVASNVGGFGASVVTGWAVGAAVGSFVPVGGTVVGAVLGAAAGGIVGVLTSDAIDGLWENGGDLGRALQDGLDELMDAGAAVGDSLSRAWDSIFG
jgi:hypothetical protein